jgi:hypothetical protein
VSAPNITDQRAALVAGLRELADFIEAHPDLPVPETFTETRVEPHLHGTDEEDRAEVDRIAAIIGAVPETTRGGHYQVSRKFGGGVTYRAIAIPNQEMARWGALMSYDNAVKPVERAS